jgi:hypothetical protein
MFHVLIQIVLTALVGMYAIRSTWFLFSGIISPLLPVAAAACALCIYLFHRPPVAPGMFLWIVVGLCLAGAVANGALLTSTAPAYRDPTNFVFSAASAVLWLVLPVLLWLSASSHAGGT